MLIILTDIVMVNFESFGKLGNTVSSCVTWDCYGQFNGLSIVVDSIGKSGNTVVRKHMCHMGSWERNQQLNMWRVFLVP